MQSTIIRKKLDGIICPNCTYDIQRRLSKMEGMGEVRVSYIKSEITAEYDPGKITEQEIEQALTHMGFPPGEGRSNLLFDLIGLLIVAALYFLLTALTESVPVPEISEKMPLGLVFLSGLLGGVHCIGMCGGIMLTQHNAVAYNFGRVLSYSSMGVVFGAIGRYLAFNMQFRSVVFILAGGLVILIGLQMWGIPFLRTLRPGIPSPCRFRGGPFLVGLLTGIMPCGMLSSMWFVAASAGTAWKGAAVMAVFCAGTCVLMLVFGVLGDVITKKYNKYILKASTILIITMGLMLMIKGIRLLV